MAKDSHKDKKLRIIEALENLKDGELKNPTPFFKSINIHVNTGTDLLDLVESIREIPFTLLRDKDGKVKGILKTEEKERLLLNGLKKELEIIKKGIEELKQKRKKCKKQ